MRDTASYVIDLYYMDTLNHGHYSTYYNKGCRCDLCKSAAKAYVKSKKEKGLPEGDKRHGTTNGYFGWGCRCALCSAAMVEYNGARRPEMRSASLKANYGITSEDWETLFESQGGVCASCGDSPTEESKRRFHLDHDHDSGQVRGILCHGCNVALGLLKEDVTRIEKLAVYISQWKPF